MRKIPSTHQIFGIIVHQDPDKIYISPVHGSSDKLRLRNEWYEKYNDFSTNTLINADIVWLIDFSSISEFPDKYLKITSVIASYAKKDSEVTEVILKDYKKYISKFLVGNQNDKEYLKSLGIENIEVTDRFRDITYIYSVIKKNFI